MSRPARKPYWAALIVPHIPTHIDNGWISVQELMDRTNLRYMQVIAAVAYLRERFPEYPLISSHSGYQFSLDPERLGDFWRWRARSAKTTLTRLWNGALHPYFQHNQAHPYARLVQRQGQRFIEDLTYFIELAEV